MSETSTRTFGAIGEVSIRYQNAPDQKCWVTITHVESNSSVMLDIPSGGNLCLTWGDDSCPDDYFDLGDLNIDDLCKRAVERLRDTIAIRGRNDSLSRMAVAEIMKCLTDPRRVR